MRPAAPTTLSEADLFALLDDAKRVFLLEPKYERKHPPLGLAKIAGYVRGRGGKVKYARAYLGEKCDLICCTSLFTYEAPAVVRAVRQAVELGNGIPVVVGGIYASLMPQHLAEKTDGRAHVFAGYSQTLDQTIPDYSINWRIEREWTEFSYVFTTRGCVHTCAYCAVPRIESNWINPTWRDHIRPDKPHVMICDNNILATPPAHVNALFKALKGKRVCFDGGVEAAFVSEEFAEGLATLDYIYTGMRIGFDRIADEASYRQGVERLIRAGVSPNDMLSLALFNFNDTPREADYRMRVCRSYRIRPYPQRFQPLNQTHRRQHFVGKHWTRRLGIEFRNYWLAQGRWAGGQHTFDDTVRKYGRTFGFGPEEWEKWALDADKYPAITHQEMRRAREAGPGSPPVSTAQDPVMPVRPATSPQETPPGPVPGEPTGPPA